MKAKRQHVGTVGVDTAMIYIGDPCYIAHTPLGHSADDPQDRHWGTFLTQINGGDGPDDWLKTAATVEGTLPNGQTKFPAGMVVKTGEGDGEYDVYITLNSEGRVASVEVVFIDD